MNDVQANKYAPLLAPFKIGNVELDNRFVMGPMGMSWLTDEQSAHTDEAIAFYEERAKGGFGAIITGVNLVDQTVDPPMGAGTVMSYAPEHFVFSRKEGKQDTTRCFRVVPRRRKHRWEIVKKRLVIDIKPFIHRKFAIFFKKRAVPCLCGDRAYAIMKCIYHVSYGITKSQARAGGPAGGTVL